MPTSGAVSSSRQHFDGYVHDVIEPCGGQRACVRQNRVVLAVVATVKPWRRRHSRQPARCPRLSRRRGRPERTRLPGEHGISRPTTAQGRPSDWLHLYAAVRFSCVCFSRSGPRVPAGTRSSLRPLSFEGKATKQSSGETGREAAKVRLLFKRGLVPRTLRSVLCGVVGPGSAQQRCTL